MMRLFLGMNLCLIFLSLVISWTSVSAVPADTIEPPFIFKINEFEYETKKRNNVGVLFLFLWIFMWILCLLCIPCVGICICIQQKKYRRQLNKNAAIANMTLRQNDLVAPGVTYPKPSYPRGQYPPPFQQNSGQSNV